MGILQIRRAEREGSRLVFAFAGWTGKGKTYTAIQFGYGLAGYDPSKLGFLDAENKRGSLLADILEKSTRPTKDRFLIADLYAPFSPSRYATGIEEFQAAGVEVLIIDSVTHEWEGTGGCQEIAEAGNPKIPNWNRAKEQHKKFMNKLLQSDMHIIVCVRAREKTKPERKAGKLEFVEQGLQPIQEKNFMFEVTASLMMHDEGLRQDVIKCPAALVNILGRKQGYITADDGFSVREWVSGARKLDPTVEKYRNRLNSNTEGGVKHIEECWIKTPEAIREALGKGFYETLVAAAKGYEEHEQLKREGAQEGEQASALVGSTGERTAEQLEADAIAARARETAAQAPVTNAQQQTPAQQVTARASLPADPIPAQPKPAEAQPAATIAQPAASNAQPPGAAVQPKPAPAQPKQAELAPVVKGVLPSDPMF